MTTTELGVTADLRDASPQVRDALSALGRLLGAALVEPPRNLRTFAEEHLGVPAARISAVTQPLRGVHAALVHVEVGRLVADVPGADLADDYGCNAPGYELVTVDVDEQIAAPDDLAAYLPAGTVFAFDAVLVLTHPGIVPLITLRVRRADLAAARAALSELVARAIGPGNFYRGRTVLATANDYGVDLKPIGPATTTRADVVQPQQVWDEIDANIGGLVRNGAALAAAGLGASRGLLLAGPPGVGKTALVRVIANELPTGWTVVIVDSAVTANGLGRVYEMLADLAPAAVVLDDIDLMTGSRRNGGGGPSLAEFLTQLDGFSPPAAVITIATTNAADSLDPALLRPGRFDSAITIGWPGIEARRQILRRYLTPLGVDLDVDAVAARTEGASGADLRELVRRAVLEHGPELDGAALLSVVDGGHWRDDVPTGNYL